MPILIWYQDQLRVKSRTWVALIATEVSQHCPIRDCSQYLHIAVPPLGDPSTVSNPLTIWFSFSEVVTRRSRMGNATAQSFGLSDCGTDLADFLSVRPCDQIGGTRP